ncbi:MAG: hypothetical protein ABEK04_03245 [Candidatus Nanohalobium sp.]
MEFQNQEAEEPYKAIVNSGGGLGMTEIVSRPEDYLQALEENEELRPQDLEKYDAAERAFEVLEDAGFVRRNGDFRTYEVVEYDPEAREEVFSKLGNLKEELLGP